jgi:Asp-tRNA(Asn)/Glu-tRNA(Gln) amidotransferase A subunit family amidase
MLKESALYSSLGELAKQIQSRQISPIELTESYLQRSETFGPKLNAYARLMRDEALEQAQTAEKEIHRGHYRGPLHGIPYAAKDLLAVKGVPTTWGAKPFADQVFDYNATVIEHLNRAGAILLGKASMIELAGGFGYTYASASLQGESRNPWDTSCWTCGSSSGSGAIVAAGLAAFAIGTETWGSIICPSAFCGASGLRPTYGRISRYGAMALSYSLDKIGPLARSAEDCTRIFAAIAGHDPLDRSTLSIDKAAFTFSPAAELKPRALRFGWLTNAWHEKDYDPTVAKVIDTAHKSLQRHFPLVKSAALPDGPWEGAANVVLACESASAFSSFIRDGKVRELVDPLGKIGGYVNLTVSGADYNSALRIREILQEKMSDLFENYDVLAAASLPVPATPLTMDISKGLDFADPLGAIGNLCGLPALSVPCGFTNKNLPVGLQFVGRAGDDAGVLQAGRSYQQVSDWHHHHPKLSS